MPYKIVRNDIVKMETEAIVNTANGNVAVGTGCDYAIYTAAGFDELLAYRREHIGPKAESQAFITPGFGLKAKHIIHVVSPLYQDGSDQELSALHACYRNALALAKEHGIKSIAFPLISTGSFKFPKEQGLRIALDEISSFLFDNEMDIYIVVFDDQSTALSSKISHDLQEYIDTHYVDERRLEEYDGYRERSRAERESYEEDLARRRRLAERRDMPRGNVLPEISSSVNSSAGRRLPFGAMGWVFTESKKANEAPEAEAEAALDADAENAKKAGVAEALPAEEALDAEFSLSFNVAAESAAKPESYDDDDYDDDDDYETDMNDENTRNYVYTQLGKLPTQLSTTFSEHLLHLIKKHGMTNAEAYNKAMVDKKLFGKIKNNPDYHPKKITVLKLCIGAKLNMDEARDLLARAGYAMSPGFLEDLIFSYFIENRIYDIVEVDFAFEKFGLPSFIVTDE